MDPQNQPSQQPGMPGQSPSYGPGSSEPEYPLQPTMTQQPAQPQSQPQQFQPPQPTMPQASNPVTAPQSQAVPPGVPMQTMQQAVLTSNPVNASMRTKILKIIVGLTVFSLIGVGLMFVLGNSPDGSLSNLTDDSNDLATYKVPADWTSETSSDSVDYFNGDTLSASSAVVSVITPQRLKFSGDPLTEDEIKQVIREVADLESRDLGGGIEVQSQEDVEVEGFDRVVEFVYDATAVDNQTKIHGKFRIYFDSNAYLHGFEVAAVKSYWTVNEDGLNTILESYSLN